MTTRRVLGLEKVDIEQLETKNETVVVSTEAEFNEAMVGGHPVCTRCHELPALKKTSLCIACTREERARDEGPLCTICNKKPATFGTLCFPCARNADHDTPADVPLSDRAVAFAEWGMKNPSVISRINFLYIMMYPEAEGITPEEVAAYVKALVEKDHLSDLIDILQPPPRKAVFENDEEVRAWVEWAAEAPRVDYIIWARETVYRKCGVQDITCRLLYECARKREFKEFDKLMYNFA